MEGTEKEYHETTDKKEVEALDKFRKALNEIKDPKDKDLINPNILADNDMLIHFLRARKLNVKKSTKMILDFLHWQINFKIESIYNDYELKDLQKLKNIAPHGLHKVTKDGHPIYLLVLGFLDPDELFKAFPREEIIKYAAKVFMSFERETFGICSKLQNTYIHGMFGICDFKGMKKSLINKKLISLVGDLLKICQDYFPESLEGCFAINTGLLFRALYSACKVFLDSKTKQKIKVYGSKYQLALLEKIDSLSLPNFLGGICQCPNGCAFSGAGPWKTEEVNENIPEDIMKRRKEINDILTKGKLESSPDDKVKNDDEGVSGESLE